MLKFTVLRLAAMVPRLVGVILVVMLLTDLMPGDPAEIMAGDNATPEAVAAIHKQLNLDRPVWERFAIYIGHVVRGNLGTSPGTTTPVRDRITAALPVTASLVLVSMLITVLVGVGAGAIAARHSGRPLDRMITALTSVLLAVPTFVIGLLLVIQFGVKRTWFPAGGYSPISDGAWNWVRHLILPGLALALVSSAELARQARGAIIDALDRDFIRSARAKGLPEFLVFGKHVAKNAATPIVTVVGLQVARVLGGTIVVERIFGMHGFGSLAVDAVIKRDIVLLQGVVLVAALAVLVTNLLVDLSYGYLNPRVLTRIQAS